jgi:hypothetical protein
VTERTWPMVLTSENHRYGSRTSVCTTTVCSKLRSPLSTTRVNNPERAGEAPGGQTVQSERADCMTVWWPASSSVGR